MNWTECVRSGFWSSWDHLDTFLIVVCGETTHMQCRIQGGKANSCSTFPETRGHVHHISEDFCWYGQTVGKLSARVVGVFLYFWTELSRDLSFLELIWTGIPLSELWVEPKHNWEWSWSKCGVLHAWTDLMFIWLCHVINKVERCFISLWPGNWDLIFLPAIGNKELTP